jgi:hypothetical protein
VTKEVARDARDIASHAVWRTMCGAYILYTAVLGVYAFWGPKAGKRIYGLPGETADLAFGGVTVLTGVCGSLIGGALLDRLGATLSNANLVCGVGQLLGVLLLLPAFLLTRSFAAFVALFAAGELALFTLQAPVAAIGMWCVPAALRPLAISLVTVSIHLLGDVPSPPLIGALQSALEAGRAGPEADAQWRVSMAVATCGLAVSGAVFLAGARVSRDAPDYRRPEEREAAEEAAEQHHLPFAHHTHGDAHEGHQHPQRAAAAAAADGGGALRAGGGVPGQLAAAEAGAAGGSGSTRGGTRRPERQPLLPPGARAS